MNKNLLILLRCIATGDRTIFQTPKGDYVAIQCRGMKSIVPEGSEERSIEGRLQYELLGEYPLSSSQMPDWMKMREAFKMPQGFAFHNFDVVLRSFLSHKKQDVEKAIEGIDGLFVKEGRDGAVNLFVKEGYDYWECLIAFEKNYKS